MKIKVILSLALALSFGACNSEKEVETAPSVYDDITIELNNGEKWDISDNMKSYMTKSSKVVSTESTNYDEISESLNDLKENFISSCDMKGEGHDVLHSWLLPYIDLLKEFENAKSDSDKEDALEQIRIAHDVFNEYFE